MQPPFKLALADGRGEVLPLLPLADGSIAHGHKGRFVVLHGAAHVLYGQVVEIAPQRRVQSQHGTGQFELAAVPFQMLAQLRYLRFRAPGNGHAVIAFLRAVVARAPDPRHEQTVRSDNADLLVNACPLRNRVQRYRHSRFTHHPLPDDLQVSVQPVVHQAVVAAAVHLRLICQHRGGRDALSLPRAHCHARLIHRSDHDFPACHHRHQHLAALAPGLRHDAGHLPPEGVCNAGQQLRALAVAFHGQCAFAKGQGRQPSGNHRSNVFARRVLIPLHKRVHRLGCLARS